MLTRREFVQAGAVCAGVVVSGRVALGKSKPSVPSYLEGYEALYAEDPRQAAVKCFRESKFGLFMHYGLYSLLEGHWQGQHA